MAAPYIAAHEGEGIVHGSTTCTDPLPGREHSMAGKAKRHLTRPGKLKQRKKQGRLAKTCNRVRPTEACHRCRAKHLKCEPGPMPCANCVTSQSPCLVTDLEGERVSRRTPAPHPFLSIPMENGFGHAALPDQQSLRGISVPGGTSPATGHLVGPKFDGQPRGPYMTTPSPCYEQGQATSRPFGLMDQGTYPQFNAEFNDFSREVAVGNITAASAAGTAPDTTLFWHGAYFGDC